MKSLQKIESDENESNSDKAVVPTHSSTDDNETREVLVWWFLIYVDFYLFLVSYTYKVI